MGLRIDLRADYHGVPMGEVRRILRECIWRERVDVDEIAEMLDRAPSAASRLRAALRRDGYLECLRVAGKRDHTRWTVTTLGRSLASARATKPIRRATADRLVAAVAARAAETHAPDYLLAWRVGALWVFGSYLSDRPSLGDVDIAFERAPRLADPNAQREYEKERVRLAMQAGRQFGSIFRELIWPEMELERFLKQGSRAISLHDTRENRAFLESVERRQIFPSQSMHGTGRAVPTRGEEVACP